MFNIIRRVAKEILGKSRVCWLQAKESWMEWEDAKKQLRIIKHILKPDKKIKNSTSDLAKKGKESSDWHKI